MKKQSLASMFKDMLTETTTGINNFSTNLQAAVDKQKDLSAKKPAHQRYDIEEELRNRYR